mmetsp:Transcript_8374/g.15806  ORF Transcript_8374/g.15806 Transcript_8374/m.15806 type:complete len:201 (-) Transcript_8374:179-781(-)
MYNARYILGSLSCIRSLFAHVSSDSHESTSCSLRPLMKCCLLMGPACSCFIEYANANDSTPSGSRCMSLRNSPKLSSSTSSSSSMSSSSSSSSSALFLSLYLAQMASSFLELAASLRFSSSTVLLMLLRSAEFTANESVSIHHENSSRFNIPSLSLSAFFMMSSALSRSFSSLLALDREAALRRSKTSSLVSLPVFPRSN